MFTTETRGRTASWLTGLVPVLLAVVLGVQAAEGFHSHSPEQATSIECVVCHGVALQDQTPTASLVEAPAIVRIADLVQDAPAPRTLRSTASALPRAPPTVLV